MPNKSRCRYETASETIFVNFVDPTGRAADGTYQPGDPIGKNPWHTVSGFPETASQFDQRMLSTLPGSGGSNVADYFNGQLQSVAQNPFTLAGMQIVAGFTPGVGEGMDAYDSVYGATGFDRWLGRASLGANAATFGVLPNAGGIRRGISGGLDALSNLTGSSASRGNLVEFIGDNTRNTQLALPAPTTSNPYPDGVPLNAGRAPEGMVIEMAMSPGQPINRPGGFGTLDNITDVSYVRNELAVTPEFKSDIGFVQRYEVAPGTQIQWGPVGSQTYDGVDYLGGGSQVQILVPPSQRSNVLTPIGGQRVIE